MTLVHRLERQHRSMSLEMDAMYGIDPDVDMRVAHEPGHRRTLAKL